MVKELAPFLPELDTLDDADSTARWILSLAHLLMRNYEEARVHIEKAIELNPNRLMHYIELGRVYAQMGRTDDARRFIAKGLAMQNTEKDDPETKREGRELLARLH